MIDLRKAPFLVGVVSPRTLEDDLNCLLKDAPDMIEYRADLGDTLNESRVVLHLEGIREVLPFPILFTLRDKSEGGCFDGNDSLRASLYRAALPHVAAIDIETSNAGSLESIRTEAQLGDATLILSYHNFSETPPDALLEDVVDRALSLGADIAKIATMCATPEDAHRLLSVPLRHESKGIAVVGMGAYGRVTRIAAPAFGSLLGYAFTGTSDMPVPGQLTVTELREAWRLAGYIR